MLHVWMTSLLAFSSGRTLLEVFVFFQAPDLHLMCFFMAEMRLPPLVPRGLRIPESMLTCPSLPISQTKSVGLLPFPNTITLAWILPPQLTGCSRSLETCFSILYSFPETLLVYIPAPPSPHLSF